MENKKEYLLENMDNIMKIFNDRDIIDIEEFVDDYLYDNNMGAIVDELVFDRLEVNKYLDTHWDHDYGSFIEHLLAFLKKNEYNPPYYTLLHDYDGPEPYIIGLDGDYDLLEFMIKKDDDFVEVLYTCLFGENNKEEE